VSARAENGVSGGGLTTTVHPAARAAPIFLVIIADGKFHGVKMDLNKIVLVNNVERGYSLFRTQRLGQNLSKVIHA